MPAHAIHHATALAPASVPSAEKSGTRAKALAVSPLRLARLETGTSAEELAGQLGCSRALVRKLEDGALTVERVALIVEASPRFGRALVRVLVAQLGALLREPAVPIASAVPELAAETGDVAHAYLEAMVDGELSADELRTLDRELADVGRVVDAGRRWVAERMGEGRV